MASSGWQTQKNIYTYNANVTIIGNVNIQSITRSGTSVTITGQIKIGARGTSGYYAYYNYGIMARPGAGSYTKILGNGVHLVNGSSNDKTINFTRTMTVEASSTTATLTVNYKACYNSDCSSTYWTASPSWTIDVGPGVVPEDMMATADSATWDSVTATGSVSNWDELPDSKIMRLLISEEPYVAGVLGRRADLTTSPQTVAITNSSTPQSAGPINILGCGLYYAGLYVTDGTTSYRAQGTSIYSPPAPASITYQQADEDQWQITFTGDPNKNKASYDAASLTRSLRYKIDDGAWVDVDSAAVKAIDAITTVTITIPAGQTATVEGWMTYHGAQSEVASTSITNGASPVHLYGSANDLSKEIGHLYGSVGGRAVKITKLYASVGGIAKKIFEDT